MSDSPNRGEAGLAALLALTGHYFARKTDAGQQLAGFEEAAFFAHRKPRAWSGWAGLPAEEQDLIRQVMLLTPTDWTDPRRIKNAALAVLDPLAEDEDPQEGGGFGGCLVLPPGEPRAADGVLLRVGGDPLGYASRLVDPFFSFGKRPRALAFAGPGKWRTRSSYLGPEHGVTSRDIEFQTTPAFREAAGHEALPQFNTRPYQVRLAPSVVELLDVAELLSGRDASVRYLRDRLGLFLAGLRSDGGEVTELDLTAGTLHVLNAPTASGKSVLMRVLASWAALNGHKLALAVTDDRTARAVTWDISSDLDYLHRTYPERLPCRATCVRLVSPVSMHRRALEYAALNDKTKIVSWSPRVRATVGSTAYGCAQRPLMEPAGLYPPGDENCTTLTSAEAGSTGSTNHLCPHLGDCGKWQPFYQAADATIVVTNHANVLSGRVKPGAVLDGQEHQGKARGTRGITVLELLLRCCDALVVDEIDACQETAINQCSTDTTLASQRREPDLWAIQRDWHQLPLEHKSNLRPALNHAHDMASALLGWLCRDGGLRMNPPRFADDSDSTRRQNTGWRLATSYDRRLLLALFPEQVSSEDEVPPELFQFLNKVMPPWWHEPNRYALVPTVEGVDWDSFQDHLKALVTERSEDYFDAARGDLYGLLTPEADEPETPAAGKMVNPRRRAAVVNQLIMRAVLLELDTAMANLVHKAQDLRHLDLASVRKLLEHTGHSQISSLFPTSYLGRTIFGYQVKGMENKATDAELLTRNFGGDPHGFIAELGGLTALMAAGVQRPVLGLSATSFFPQAVEQHVHASVRWWIPDARPGSIVTIPETVYPGGDRSAAPYRVAGQFTAHKPAILRGLGRDLYEQKLSKRLRQLERNDADRARIICTTNSYEQAAHLAAGIAMADGLRHEVALLVKSREKPQDYEQHVPDHVRRIVREELEEVEKIGQILIAPLAVIYRGLNMVVGSRSAVSAVYVCTRPVLSIEATDWLHASVNAAGLRALPPGGSDDPLPALDAARSAAWKQLATILGSPQQFSNINPALQDELIAGMLIQLIQLAGRARRGDTDMTLHIVDNSLHDDSFAADMATVIRRIHAAWTPEQRSVMTNLYGEALGSFLSYAGIHPQTV